MREACSSGRLFDSEKKWKYACGMCSENLEDVWAAKTGEMYVLQSVVAISWEPRKQEWSYWRRWNTPRMASYPFNRGIESFVSFTLFLFRVAVYFSLPSSSFSSSYSSSAALRTSDQGLPRNCARTSPLKASNVRSSSRWSLAWYNFYDLENSTTSNNNNKIFVWTRLLIHHRRPAQASHACCRMVTVDGH